GRPDIKTQVIHFLNKPMPKDVPTRTSRGLLDVEDDTLIPVIRDPQRAGDESEAVFYFPGCGSERLFSQVGLATQAMLWHAGATTVLPPGYLCCGYPQTASGDEDKGQAITMANRILFHRVANTLNYLDIKTVVVSCGTCMDQLLKYEFGKIFPDCRLVDIHEWLMEKGIKLDGTDGQFQGMQYMYHEPCHTPMKHYSGIKVASTLMGQSVTLNDRCCGESGSLAVSRPDISTQIRFRKQEEMEKGAAQLRETSKLGARSTVKILTSCPSCLQGLSRYDNDAEVTADYIVVEMAKTILGPNWLQDYIHAANNGGIERVLL
ncbi:MAG: (Fe-S)-binding protein, partial [Sulfuritalea sp.]|nr:(Fe-S)-binding protein [Sulfuritalea sp.]